MKELEIKASEFNIIIKAKDDEVEELKGRLLDQERRSQEVSVRMCL